MKSQGSVLYVDAYDSFAENITALLHQHLHVQVTLIQIDCNIKQVFKQSLPEFFASFDAIVLGPGPGNPRNAEDVGLFGHVWEYAGTQKIPVLGICLGFQSLCAQYGIPVVRLPLPCHGHAKEIWHVDKDIFQNTGSIVATCYNSLGVTVKQFKQDEFISPLTSTDSSRSTSPTGSIESGASVSLPTSKTALGSEYHNLKDELEVLAWDNDWVMAVRHKFLPFHGLQFHPESCKSNMACQTLIVHWWATARSHNKRHRDLIRSQEPASLDPHTRNTIMPSKEAKALLRAMLSATRSCRGSLERKSLHLPGGSSMIADLCRNHSRPDSTAMLESTKRGRHNIYAFPHESSFLLESSVGRVVMRFPAQSTNSQTTYCLEREQFDWVLETHVHAKTFPGNDAHIPFTGGFIGFMSYEFGTASLRLKVPQQDRTVPSAPEISLLWVDRCVAYDHEAGTAHVQSIWEDDPWVEVMTNTLQSTFEASHKVPTPWTNEAAQQILRSATIVLPDHDEYVNQIGECQDQLLAGNSYELCLTTEATVSTPASADGPYLLYRNIQRHNPVPFAAYISLNMTTVLSSSPEQFLSWSSESGTIDMIPMKGTVKRTPEITLAKATAILSSAKESAENLMIADLIRHDLYSTVGRGAKVEVVRLCDVVELETVYSLVSHIRAHPPMSPDTEMSLDAKSKNYAQQFARYGIRALVRTLPPGSMTGAPKKRSCEILHGLEQRDRGVYSGAIGYIDVCGNGAWAVCIRSAFSNRDDNFKHEMSGKEMQQWRIGAGGAITVLSDEEQEWEEMMTKLESVVRGFRVE